jgi:hypothetical protein
LFDELDGIGMQDLEVIRSVCHFPGLIAHEVDILLDVLDILDVLLGWVGIVETEVAMSLAHLGLHEVETHGLAMSNVKVAIGLWWETG